MLYNRKLPIGIQDFEDLRTNGYVYVDKTEYVHRLATRGKPYFLGRPRRFGKSLFLSTLKAYFLGKKELFEGLAIGDLEKEWTEYPVFHIDMNVESYTDLASLYRALDTNLGMLEKTWGKDETEMTPASRLLGLIHRAGEQTGRKAVVLVDEYDKPLVSTLDRAKENEDMRTLLKGFYGILKSADAYLRFVFLTGVTKFSKVSIFSDLNHLVDISLQENYAGICGISERELTDFQPEVQALADRRGKTYAATLLELKKRYDGYHFAKESEGMYNPFSLLNTLDQKDFGNYWFATGTPTFLVKMLRNTGFDIESLENGVKIPADAITDYRAEYESPVPLLYQSGYLTIKSYSSRYNSYTLGFPNEEVKYGFLNELLPAYMPKKDIRSEFYAEYFIEDLLAGDVESFMNRLRAFFAGIPYELNSREEKYYQTVFYLFFRLMGQFIEVEQHGAVGRADAVVTTDDTVFVFEFKLTGNATAEDALRQIDEKNYLIPFTAGNRKLVKVGVEFSSKERGISRWKTG
ncbi:MAG: ATP-binding protein [Tannerella sp.]|jgi:hypothetical protein|nr:ATP-binding protein [Tannerella sp.]